jgi:putative peptidoglycan lipid II flippase
MTIETSLTETVPPEILPDPAEHDAHQTGLIARTAGLIAFGNITSRVLGLAVYTVKSHFFGAGAAVDAFNAASRVPIWLYDLLVGGQLNSSLVPVFTEYAADRRKELWEVLSTLLLLAVIALSLVVIAVEIFAPAVVYSMGSGFDAGTMSLAVTLLRIMAPSILFLGLAGVLTGVLFALQRFSYPAFMGAVLNAGVVVTTLVFQAQMGITSMAVGLLAGAILQVALQASGLRDAALRIAVNLNHPALRRVLILNIPILIGMMVDILIVRPVSLSMISGVVGGISWMDYATSLVQMPQGLVAVAVSAAVLPLLSAQAVDERKAPDSAPFRATLARGMRLVLVLIIPAAVGLFVLARPVVALVFEHGEFLVRDTQMTTFALQLYLLGLPFAAIDLLLVYAFYARQDTLTPALIGIACHAVYLVVAFMLLNSLGIFTLMVADSIKQFLHALLCAVVLRRRLGGLGGRSVLRTLAIILLSAAVMSAVSVITLTGVECIITDNSLLTRTLIAIVPALSGGLAYAGLVTWFRVEEIKMLWSAVQRRITRSE